MTLEDIVLHDEHLDGVLEVDAGWRQEERAGTQTSVWHLATRHPESLRARGFALDRTASLTLTYDADWDDFSGHIRFAGTVDDAASAYDYGWWDGWCADGPSGGTHDPALRRPRRPIRDHSAGRSSPPSANGGPERDGPGRGGSCPPEVRRARLMPH